MVPLCGTSPYGIPSLMIISRIQEACDRVREWETLSSMPLIYWWSVNLPTHWLAHSRSPHNVLHSPSNIIVLLKIYPLQILLSWCWSYVRAGALIVATQRIMFLCVVSYPVSIIFYSLLLPSDSLATTPLPSNSLATLKMCGHPQLILHDFIKFNSKKYWHFSLWYLSY